MKRYLILMMILVGLYMLSSCCPEPKTYTVTFDSAGGSEVEPQVVGHACRLEKPTDPVKECACDFAGWYWGEYEWSFVGYVVTEDMTLTARWIDCFGLSRREKDHFKSFDFTKIESIELIERDATMYCYKITFIDGSERMAYISAKLLEEENE